MKVLIVTTVLPDRCTTGGEIATKNFIDGLLSLGHQVEVLGFRRPGDEDADDPMYVSMGARHIETSAAGYLAIFWLFLSFVNFRPYIVQKFYSKHYQVEIEKRIVSGGYDFVVIDHSQMGWVGKLVFGKIKSIFVAHNAESMLYMEQSKNSSSHGAIKRFILRRDASLIRSVEILLCQRANQVWTLVESERKYFSAFCDESKVHVIPLPGQGGGDMVLKKDLDVGLIGTWAWDVNRKGLEWFVEKVIPLLPSGLTVSIAGKGADFCVGKDDRLNVLGFVDDAFRFMSSCKVIVVPTTIGAGVQLKTIEAISVGSDVVSTSLGVRGIDSLPSYVTVADRPEEMARAIVDACVGASGLSSGRGKQWAETRRFSFLNSISNAISQL